MERYPTLSAYRVILTILGWLIIGGGMLLGLSLANATYNYNYSSSFSWEAFLPTAVISIIMGGSFLITSEIIGVLVNIESRLIEMRDLDRRRMAGEKEAASSYNEIQDMVSPELPLAHLKKLWESGDKVVMPIGTIVANHNQVVIEAVATTDYLLLRDIPNPTAKPVKKILLGEEVNVIGVSQDFNWFLLRDTFNKLYWARSTGLTLQGDVSMLPVVSL